MLIRCGDDLLSHVLRRSTISAVALNGRVRDGIGCFAHAMITTPKKHGGSPRRSTECARHGCYATVRRHRVDHLGGSVSATGSVFTVDCRSKNKQLMLCVYVF